MYLSLISFLRGRVRGTEHERTTKLKYNVLLSAIFRAISVGANLLLVPLTLDYLSPVKYGIWLTLGSILAWIGYFDIGLGSGLRNRLSEAFAKGDTGLGRTYVSTAYAALASIVLVAYVAFLFVNPLLDWATILNTPMAIADELSSLVFVVFTLFAIRFIAGLIGMVLTADQRPAISSGLEALVAALSVLVVIILRKTTEGSLLYLGGWISFLSASVPLVASFFFFRTRYKSIRPAVSFVRTEYAKDLASLGVKFFVLQIIFIVIFASSNIVIAQLFGPSEVTVYNIAFKYFYLVTMVFTILTSPLWSAFTDAYVKGDDRWIRTTVKKTVKLWGVLTFVAVIMLALSPIAYRLWIGQTVEIPFSLSIAMCLLVVLMTWNGVFTLFVNGVGKIQLQVLFAVGVGLCFIPLSILFAKVLNMGSAGVVLATVACMLPGSIITPLQYHRIINKKATGIWNR